MRRIGGVLRQPLRGWKPRSNGYGEAWACDRQGRGTVAKLCREAGSQRWQRHLK